MHNNGVNSQPPKHSLNDIKEFIFACLIIASTITAGVLIYKNGDSLALTPVENNQATVIQAPSSTITDNSF